MLDPDLSFLQKLNSKQLQAVNFIDGPLLVIAGPGTGKTQLLTARVANILAKTDAIPSEILCLTFTDNAEKNMVERLSGILGNKTASEVNIYTFHSLATEIINKSPEYFFDSVSFQPLDEISRLKILDENFQKLDISNPLKTQKPSGEWVYLDSANKAIQNLKSNGISPEEYAKRIEQMVEALEIIEKPVLELFSLHAKKIKSNKILELLNQILTLINTKPPQIRKSLDIFLTELYELGQIQEVKEFSRSLNIFRSVWFKEDQNKNRAFKDKVNQKILQALGELYQMYQKSLYENMLFDFDDMLTKVVESLKLFPELRYKYQEKFQYILVDEFQDTNLLQMKFIDLLVNKEINEGRPNLMVVGDDDQAIFKFQRATIANILNFEASYKNPEIVYLTENYRSNQEILDFSRKIILHAPTRLETIQNIPKILTAVKQSKK